MTEEFSPEEQLRQYFDLVRKRPEPMSEGEAAAIRNLIRIAESDTGQSRRCASFLLSWWNAAECGGFDLTDLWGVDTQVASNMLTVIRMIARVQSYPDTLGFEREFDGLVRLWRPELFARGSR
jgi:hypothetical protein